MDRFISSIVLTAGASVLGPGVCGASPQSPFTSDADYESIFFVTPNGDPNFAGEMVKKMVGGGGTAWGGGLRTKVGVAEGMWYTRFTEGPSDSYHYYVNRGPDWATLPLPPDVTSITQLPAIVRDGMDLQPGTPDDLKWTQLAQVPRLIAALEWARYLDLPLSIQLSTAVSHGGSLGANDPSIDLNIYVEGGLGNTANAKNQCMWDASDYFVPTEYHGPLNVQEADGAVWGSFTFATATLADPALALSDFGLVLPYKAYLKQNIQDGIHQLLAMASDSRYLRPGTNEGRIVAFAIDPEIHLPAHKNSVLLPALAGGDVSRAFVEDYNPVTIRQFANWLKSRYGDATPLADSNGDGKYFWGDFGPAGTGQFPGEYLQTAGFGHAHASPATWNDVDPPRNIQSSEEVPVTPYWHLWTTFRTEQVDQFLDELVGWMIEAGVPGNRIYAHQTQANASFNTFRATGTAVDGTPDPANYRQHCDDVIHFDVSSALTGISKYHPTDITSGRMLYDQLRVRDDGWGSPEFNPYSVNPYVFPPQYATDADTQTAVNLTWDTGAHVLWMHHWGLTTEQAFDCVTYRWTRNTSTCTANFTNWLASGFSVVNCGNGQERLQANSTSDYVYPDPAVSFSIPADECPFIGLELLTDLAGAPWTSGDVRTEFQTSNGVWHTGPTVSLRDNTSGTRWLPIDMTIGTGGAWAGTITSFRLYPVPTVGSNVYLKTFIAARENYLTHHMQRLMAAKKQTIRVPPVPTNSVAVTLPYDLATPISTLESAGNLVVYGTNPISGNFSDFSTTGNFYSDPTASSGGVVKPSIAAYPPSYLGLRKTGRYRRLALPAGTNLQLSFSMGLRGTSGTKDGVRYRVLVRDQDRKLTTAFDQDWRKHQWSSRKFVDLAAYAGHTIDLILETQGIADTTGDLSLWGQPKLERAYALAVSPPSGGQVTPDPAGLYGEGTVVNIVAVPNSGWVFTNWTTTGNAADIANVNSASTTVTMNGAHTLTAHFAQVLTAQFYSEAGNDGFIIEATPTNTVVTDYESNAGLRIGDTTAKKQQKGFLSFNTTTLPSGAVITGATLRLTCGTISNSPYSSPFPPMLVDMKSGYFGGSDALESMDFTAPATYAPAFQVPTLTSGQEVTLTVPAIKLDAIVPGSKTQFRLTFTGAADTDTKADYVGLWAGEGTGGAGVRPLLTVTYH